MSEQAEQIKNLEARIEKQRGEIRRLSRENRERWVSLNIARRRTDRLQSAVKAAIALLDSSGNVYDARVVLETALTAQWEDHD